MATRFGEGLKIDATNRLDSLRENKEVPALEAGLEVRRLLTEGSKEDVSWKEMPPNLASVENFFDAAKQMVTDMWNKKVQSLLFTKAKNWAEALKTDEKNAGLVAVLENEKVLEEKMRIRQFGVLEPLRQALPEAWKELVYMSSERQLAEITVARRWVKTITAEAAPAILEKWGLKSRLELDLLVDGAAMVAKFIDHAYVKQIEYADAPGGSEKSSLGTKKGAKFLYDVHTADSEVVDLLPYTEVFPFEFKHIEEKLIALAERAEQGLKTNDLGKEYEGFGPYLRAVAAQFGSRETDREKLFAGWENLQKMIIELAKAGCPIMLIPQDNASVAGDAEKVDVEIRFGFISKEIKEFSDAINYFRAKAESILLSNKNAFMPGVHVPDLIVNYQPFAHGPNTYWTTRGEDGTERILAHNNAVVEMSVTMAYPALRHVIADEITEDAFVEASIRDNILHEIGHQLTPKAKYDEKVAARLSGGTANQALEELKADTGNMKLLALTLKDGNPHQINIRDQFLAKLGDVCDYLKNKSSQIGGSGEPYFAAGLTMVSRLLDRGVLVPEGQKFRVTDPEAGVQALAELSDEVVRYYVSGTPDEHKQFVAQMRAKKEDPQVADFINKLKR